MDARMEPIFLVCKCTNPHVYPPLALIYRIRERPDPLAMRKKYAYLKYGPFSEPFSCEHVILVDFRVFKPLRPELVLRWYDPPKRLRIHPRRFDFLFYGSPRSFGDERVSPHISFFSGMLQRLLFH